MFEEETISERQKEDWFDNFIVEYANQYDKEKELFSSPKYILWLNEFTKKYESFSDDDWLYNPDKISDDDLKQVQYLGTIFNGIEAYANKNYIYSKSCDLGECYSIKLGDVAYEIIESSFPDGAYSCKRVELADDDDIIDFNDIINDKMHNDVTLIKENLKKLSCIIEEFYKSGVPLEAIMMTVNQKVQDLEVRQECDNMKRLVK